MSLTQKQRRNSRTGGSSVRSDELQREPVDAGATPESGDLTDTTLAVWQQRANRPLTREDGREIIENMTGFFGLLQEWSRVEQGEKAMAAVTPGAPASRNTPNPDIARLPVLDKS